MIRIATNSDVEGAINCGKRLHARSVYAQHATNQRAIYHHMAFGVNSKLGCLVVAEHASEITGVLLLQAAPYWWADPATGARFATDLVFGAERAGDGAQMLRKGIEWAWTVPRVVECTFGISSGITPERTATLYEALGMKNLGTMWMVERP